MKINYKQTLAEKLDNVCNLIEASDDALYSRSPNADILRSLKKIKLRLANSGPIEKLELDQLGILFGPTGSIQEVSIDNGWGDKFLELAQEIDQLSDSIKH